MNTRLGSPTLANLVFVHNTAMLGGGMGNEQSGPTLPNVLFMQNTARNLGSGIWNRHSSPTLSDSRFNENTAGGSGGGIFNGSRSHPQLIHIAEYGGGLSNGSHGLADVNPTLRNVLFLGNKADWGGGMYGSGTGETRLTNVLLAGNRASSGGAIYNDDMMVTLVNVTITGNFAKQTQPGYLEAGGGVYNVARSHMTMTNSILWGNQDSDSDSTNTQIASFQTMGLL